MSDHNLRKQRSQARWYWGKTVALFALGLPLPAFAVLGASVDSIKDDQIKFQATVKVIVSEHYRIHELTSGHGTVIRQYVADTGTVFAVSWEGPFIPDMRQLLGSYFNQYAMSAKQHRERRGEHLRLLIQQPSLVMQSSGHMLGYSGCAYDPRLLPAGVKPDDLR